MSFNEMLNDLTGSPSCPIDGCDGKVKPQTFLEYVSAIFGTGKISKENRPWIADVSGSQTGIIVCDAHDYNGDFLGS